MCSGRTRFEINKIWADFYNVKVFKFSENKKSLKLLPFIELKTGSTIAIGNSK
jgi:hypothetical protein